jgi:hypothetical protein
VVLRDGLPLAFLERGARSLTLFEGALEDPSWIEGLASLLRSKRVKRIEIQKINGQPPAEQAEARDLLLANGFAPGYKGPVLRS